MIKVIGYFIHEVCGDVNTQRLRYMLDVRVQLSIIYHLQWMF